jgi:CTP-dependent riboflavin kinase
MSAWENQVWDMLVLQSQDGDYPQSSREIAKELNASTSAVGRALHSLARKGRVERVTYPMGGKIAWLPNMGLTVKVDFNMSHRGVLPALLRGQVPSGLEKGAAVLAVDGEGNCADAVVTEIDADRGLIFVRPDMDTFRDGPKETP